MDFVHKVYKKWGLCNKYNLCKKHQTLNKYPNELAILELQLRKNK